MPGNFECQSEGFVRTSDGSREPRASYQDDLPDQSCELSLLLAGGLRLYQKDQEWKVAKIVDIFSESLFYFWVLNGDDAADNTSMKMMTLMMMTMLIGEVVSGA